MEQTEQVVDLAFPIRGGPIAADHGYPLYAAVSGIAPEVHGDAKVGIHPIRGQLIGDRRLELTATSRLVLRVPAARIARLLALVGQQLEVEGAAISIGMPTVRPLRPVPALVSRLVVIKGFMESSDFLDSAKRQVEALGVGGQVALVARQKATPAEGRTAREAGEPIRRTLRIHDKIVVGFALAVTQLTAEESMQIQETGIGGRRRFGCGLFVPLRS